MSHQPDAPNPSQPETTAARRADFMAAARGLRPRHVAKIINRRTLGIEWRGTTKGSMADKYARRATDTDHIPEVVLEDLRAAER